MTIIETTTTNTRTRWTGFRGAVVAPGEERWDAARQAYNLTVDQRPAVIAFPVDERDVATAVRFAREHGLQIAPQRTGHNAAPLGSLEDSVLLKPTPCRGSRSTRGHAGHASAPGRSGATSSRGPPSSASPLCTVPRRTSPSSATRSAAAWAGTHASAAWPPTASRRSSS